MEGSIPFGEGGYVINIRFAEESDYTVFETVGFDNVKNIYQSEESVTFQSDGYKIYFLFQPNTYTRKHVEPYLREDSMAIPLRWNELHDIETPRKDHIYVSREPYVSHGSFTIQIPAKGRFVYYLFNHAHIDEYACEFVSKVLTQDFQLQKGVLEELLVHYRSNLEFFQRAIST